MGENKKNLYPLVVDSDRSGEINFAGEGISLFWCHYREGPFSAGQLKMIVMVSSIPSKLN